jgi:hypothetical protein
MRSCSRHPTEAGTERLHKTSFSLSTIIHVTYQVFLLFVQFFDRPLFLLNMILRAISSLRVSRYFLFFLFLNYSPFCSPNTFFYPFTLFNGTGTTEFGTKSFLYFGWCHFESSLMIYWSVYVLWTCTLILVLSGCGTYFCPHFLSLSLCLS